MNRRIFLSTFGLAVFGMGVSPRLLGAAEAGQKSLILVNFHRGGGKSRPENTLETFLWAWNLEVIPECDIQFTRDRVPVTFHDSNLARLAWGIPEELKKKGVPDLDWEEVRKLDVGRYVGASFSPQRIPRLDSVFAAMRGCPNRLLYVDEKGLKETDLEVVAQLATQHEVEPQVFLTTSNYKMVRRWKEILPKSKAMIWLGTRDEKIVSKRMEELRAAGFKGIDHLNIHVDTKLANPDLFSPSSAFLQRTAAELKQHGIVFQVIPWSGGDKPETYKRILELGVESVSTDYPEICLGAVRQ